MCSATIQRVVPASPPRKINISRNLLPISECLSPSFLWRIQTRQMQLNVFSSPLPGLKYLPNRSKSIHMFVWTLKNNITEPLSSAFSKAPSKSQNVRLLSSSSENQNTRRDMSDFVPRHPNHEITLFYVEGVGCIKAHCATAFFLPLSSFYNLPSIQNEWSMPTYLARPSSSSTYSKVYFTSPCLLRCELSYIPPTILLCVPSSLQMTRIDQR